MQDYVYIVLETEIVDNIPSNEMWVFCTKEMAEVFMKKRIDRRNKDYAFYDEGYVEGDSDTLFSWTKNIGFTDNVYEIYVETQEVL